MAKAERDLMNEFQTTLIIFLIFTIIITTLVSTILYIQGKENGRKESNKRYYNDVIKEILGEMNIDENGNNVLNGGTIEYENKWKYEIGENYGLQTAIKILKNHIDKSI